MRYFATFVLILLQTGCASIFGWDIHAPGLLSQDFYEKVEPLDQRLALYLPSEMTHYVSKDRGGKTADPQTYHVGEAFVPMLIEAFQGAFSEFVSLESEPSKSVLKQYAIPHLVLVRILDFKNRVTWHGQAITVRTETVVLDPALEIIDRFESVGSSDAKKVFAKKGGPQVNLNAALENNALAVVEHLQDSIRSGAWLNGEYGKT